MIRIGSRNIRGHNGPHKQVDVRKLILDHRMGIIETKVRQHTLSTTMNHCLPLNWDHLHNSGVGVVERLIFSWNTMLCKVLFVPFFSTAFTCKVGQCVFP